MSLEAVQSAIYKRFGDNWNFTAYPVVPENQKWSTVFGSAKQPTEGAWGRISVRFVGNQDSSVDATARRASGMVWLQIFVPEEKGSLAAASMSDEMEKIFGRKTVSTAAAPPSFPAGEKIRFERAVPGYVGSDAGVEQHRCTVAFIADAVTP